jgi:hypothetical protein
MQETPRANNQHEERVFNQVTEILNSWREECFDLDFDGLLKSPLIP